MNFSAMICVFAAAIGLGGCDKSESVPQTRPAAPTPTRGPASFPATAATLLIADRKFTFAGAIIHRDKGADHDNYIVTAAQEINSDGFHFEIPIENDPANGVHWEWQTLQDSRIESLIGITLNSTNETLQPLQLNITLSPAGPDAMRVQVSGRFLVYPGESTTSSARVKVEGDFVAAIKTSR